MEFWIFDTPYGSMAAGEEEGEVVRLWLPNQPTPRLMPHKTPLLERVERQILEYCDGRRQVFDLPLSPVGTPFQRKVWQALRAIPYGQVCSYADLARQVDCPKGFRAVGMANRSNPLPILIPCHRVIASDGTLGGYLGGLELKRALLEGEGVKIPR
jgi:methylated-DNA-[protein]-cysteine S-methyltransferase